MSQHDYHQSVEKRKSSILIIWIIPFIALMIAGSMIVKYVIDKGEDIIIVFKSAEGFSTGKTLLKYKGIRVGMVSDMKVNPQNNNEFFVTVTVDNSAVPLVVREGTKFWKVEPKVSLGEVSGLSTIISGSYIEMLPGEKEFSIFEKEKLFLAEQSKPIESFQDGFLIKLRSESGELVDGSPLLYKKYTVGRVVKKELTGGSFLYTVFVKNRYKDLIKNESHFWNVSGIELKASLSGVELNVGSLASVLSGGIMFDSPKDSKILSRKDHIFELCAKKDDLHLAPRTITLIADADMDIDPSLSNVYYKGLLAGKIVKRDFLPQEQHKKIVISLNEKYYELLKNDAYFWVVTPKIQWEGISGLDALAKGNYISFDTGSKASGIKAQYLLHHQEPPRDGQHYWLRVADLGSLSQGDPIFYKHIQAGEVAGFTYDSKRDAIDVKLFIKSAFAHLINQSTHFYRQSGISFDLSRDRMTFSTHALDTVVRGGLGFVVNDKDAKAVANDYRFTLFENELTANEENVFVTVSMDRGYKLKRGSRVLYKDLKIGYVESLHFNDNKGVSAKLAISKKYADLLRKDTLVWLEDFKVTVRGVKNSPAAIFGPSLCLMPGKSKQQSRSFILSHKAPFPTYSREGLRIVVKGSRKSSLKPGSPLLYRQLKIGSVEHYDLAEDGTSVNIGLFIEKKYAHVVRKNSLFYHASAVGMKVSLSGIKVMTETLESMIYGGIGMVTPEPAAEPAHDGDSFTVELRAEEEWFEWQPKLNP